MTKTSRFWAKVNKTDTCWLWTAGTTHGYGQFSDGKRNWRAHRFAYELLRGPIPDDLVIDHLCRVKHCVNPDHLEAVPQMLNFLRGYGPAAINGRKTHCPAGHEYKESNSIPHPTGRVCKQCHKINQRNYVARKAVRA